MVCVVSLVNKPLTGHLEQPGAGVNQTSERFIDQGYNTDHGFPPSTSAIPGDNLGSQAGPPAGLVNSNHRSSVGSGSGSGAGQHSEQHAILAIEKAYAKPVAFSVRTNVMYDGTLDDDSPVHGCAVSFKIGDFLHIFEKYDGIGGLGAR